MTNGHEIDQEFLSLYKHINPHIIVTHHHHQNPRSPSSDSLTPFKDSSKVLFTIQISALAMYKNQVRASHLEKEAYHTISPFLTLPPLLFTNICQYLPPADKLLMLCRCNQETHSQVLSSSANYAYHGLWLSPSLLSAARAYYNNWDCSPSCRLPSLLLVLLSVPSLCISSIDNDWVEFFSALPSLSSFSSISSSSTLASSSYANQTQEQQQITRSIQQQQHLPLLTSLTIYDARRSAESMPIVFTSLTSLIHLHTLNLKFSDHPVPLSGYLIDLSALPLIPSLTSIRIERSSDGLSQVWDAESPSEYLLTAANVAHILSCPHLHHLDFATCSIKVEGVAQMVTSLTQSPRHLLTVRLPRFMQPCNEIMSDLLTILCASGLQCFVAFGPHLASCNFTAAHLSILAACPTLVILDMRSQEAPTSALFMLSFPTLRLLALDEPNGQAYKLELFRFLRFMPVLQYLTYSSASPSPELLNTISQMPLIVLHLLFECESKTSPRDIWSVSFIAWKNMQILVLAGKGFCGDVLSVESLASILSATPQLLDLVLFNTGIHLDGFFLAARHCPLGLFRVV